MCRMNLTPLIEEAHRYGYRSRYVYLARPGVQPLQRQTKGTAAFSLRRCSGEICLHSHTCVLLWSTFLPRVPCSLLSEPVARPVGSAHGERRLKPVTGTRLDNRSSRSMEEAAARKERLKAMRAKAQAATEADTPVLKFRNYAPRDGNISHEKVEAAKVPDAAPIDAQTTMTEPMTIPSADGQAENVSVAPKKANWDLRRDVEEKLAKLERRTQRAMVELMREEEQNRLEMDE